MTTTGNRNPGMPGAGEELPQNFLNGNSLTPDQWESLSRNCSSQASGPLPGQTTFIFSQWAPDDHHDLTLIADGAANTWTAIPKPHCSCHRGALECECWMSVCNRCGARMTGVSAACESELCVQDDCPICNHEREECGYQRILEGIQDETRKQVRLGESIAQAHVRAVSGWLAPGTGDAPLFNCTIRILDELINASHDPDEAIRNQRRGLRWECRDGSAVLHDPGNQGWLTFAEA